MVGVVDFVGSAALTIRRKTVKHDQTRERIRDAVQAYWRRIESPCRPRRRLKASLIDKGRTTTHAELSAGRVQKFIDGCKWKRISDVSASAAQFYLTQRRESQEQENGKLRDGLSMAPGHRCLMEVKGFGRWPVREGRARENPHAHTPQLARGGVHPKIAQALAPRSDINLTMGGYSHTVFGELVDGLAALPNLDRAAHAIETVWRTGGQNYQGHRS